MSSKIQIYRQKLQRSSQMSNSPKSESSTKNDLKYITKNLKKFKIGFENPNSKSNSKLNSRSNSKSQQAPQSPPSTPIQNGDIQIYNESNDFPSNNPILSNTTTSNSSCLTNSSINSIHYLPPDTQIMAYDHLNKTFTLKSNNEVELVNVRDIKAYYIQDKLNAYLRNRGTQQSSLNGININEKDEEKNEILNETNKFDTNTHQKNDLMVNSEDIPEEDDIEEEAFEEDNDDDEIFSHKLEARKEKNQIVVDNNEEKIKHPKKKEKGNIKNDKIIEKEKNGGVYKAELATNAISGGINKIVLPGGSNTVENGGVEVLHNDKGGIACVRKGGIGNLTINIPSGLNQVTPEVLGLTIAQNISDILNNQKTQLPHLLPSQNIPPNIPSNIPSNIPPTSNGLPINNIQSNNMPQNMSQNMPQNINSNIPPTQPPSIQALLTQIGSIYHQLQNNNQLP